MARRVAFHWIYGVTALQVYVGLCVGLGLLVLAFAYVKPWPLGWDYWETAAAIRALAANVLHPTNPIVDLPGSTSPRFVPYTVFWGIVMKMTGAGTFYIMGAASLVNHVLLSVGLYRFTSYQFRHSVMPVYALVVMLLVWGTGYKWANSYDLGQYLITAGYTGFFAFAVSLHALFFASRYVKNGQRKDSGWFLVLATLVVLSHPPTGGFCLLAAGALALSEAWPQRQYGRLVAVVVAGTVAVASLFVWPYFSYWATMTQGLTTDWFYSPLYTGLGERLGMAWAGVPVLVYFALRGRYLSVVWGFLLCMGMYLFARLVEMEIGGRFLFFWTFFLHLALALVWCELHRWASSRGQNKRLHVIGIVVAFLVLPVWERAQEARKYLPGMPQKVGEVAPTTTRPDRIHAYLFLRAHLGPGDVVMAQGASGWVLPALTGAKTVAVFHPQPLVVAEAEERAQAVDAFFEDALPWAQREALLNEYSVTHVLTETTTLADSLEAELRLAGSLVEEENGLALYAVGPR